MLDVAVLGLSVAGVSAALAIRRCGARVAVVALPEIPVDYTFEATVRALSSFPMSGRELEETLLHILALNQIEHVRAWVVRERADDGAILVMGDRSEFLPIEARFFIDASNGSWVSGQFPSGHESLWGLGFSAALLDDISFFHEQRVCILGDGCWAYEQSRHALHMTSAVTVLLDRESFPSRCRSRQHENVRVRPQTRAVAIDASMADTIRVTTESGEKIAFDAVFSAFDPVATPLDFKRVALRAGLPNGIPYDEYDLLWDDGTRAAERLLPLLD